MDVFPFISLEFQRFSPEEKKRRIKEFLEHLSRRRTVREFSSEPVDVELVEQAIRVAGTAPSGANRQPWTFVVVTNAEIKRKIREAAEAEERDNYGRRFPDEWLDALAHLGTDWQKEFLEVAPCLIVVFRQSYGVKEEVPADSTGESLEAKNTDEHESNTIKHYYVMESVGIAVGMLLAALHWAGLATLTHTPSPMKFLSKILQRPPNEKPYILIPVGYPAEGTKIPNIHRKPLYEIMVRFD